MAMSAVVKHKGSNPYARSELQRFLIEVGRTNGVLQTDVLQTDQEAAIQALARDVATRMGMSHRLAPAYSSRSMGAAERWHQELWGGLRVMIDTIKKNYDIKIHIDDPLTTWMVKHASWLYNRYQIHSDGKTSYERRWGNAYVRPICEFGETALMQYADHKDHGKQESTWVKAIWLGRCTQSDERFTATEDGVFRARAVRRLLKAERYDKAPLEQVTATPSETRGVGKAPTDDSFVLNLPKRLLGTDDKNHTNSALRRCTTSRTSYHRRRRWHDNDW